MVNNLGNLSPSKYGYVLNFKKSVVNKSDRREIINKLTAKYDTNLLTFMKGY